MEIQISADQKTLIQGYKQEAFTFLGEAEQSMQAFKDIVAAASETTKLPKGIISKYFKTSFKDDVKKVEEEAEIISFLNS